MHVTRQKYAGVHSAHFIMEEFKILYCGEKEEDVKKASSIPHIVGGVQHGLNIRTGRSTEMEDCESDLDDIADEIAGGREHRERCESDDVKFSCRPPMGITPYIGAAIKFASTIKYWDRKVYLDCKEAFLDAQAEIEADEDHIDSDEQGGGEREEIISQQSNRGTGVKPSDVRLEAMNRNRNGAIHTCIKCTKTFRRADKLSEHENLCDADVRVQQSTLHRAAELASNLVYSGSTEHDIIYNPLGHCSYLCDVNVIPELDAIHLEQGWAERPVEGETIGKNNEPRYRPLIDRHVVRCGGSTQRASYERGNDG